MNNQSKDDVLWILFCACIGLMVFINLIADDLVIRFITLIFAGFWAVVSSHSKWEE